MFLLPAVCHPIKYMDLLVLFFAPVDTNLPVLLLLSADEVEPGADK